MCPRCKKEYFKTININRFGTRMPVNKCLVCGFLWINDSDLKVLNKAESKRIFIDYLKHLDG